VIRLYEEIGNVIETHEHKGDFKECFRKMMMIAMASQAKRIVLVLALDPPRRLTPKAFAS
jgi:hypothetical protein